MQALGFMVYSCIRPWLLAGNVDDQKAVPGEWFVLVLPPGLFADPDRTDPLNLAAGLGPDLAPLPPWLFFDPVVGAFSGTPDTPDSYLVTIAATDTDGETAATSFQLQVAVPPYLGPTLIPQLGIADDRDASDLQVAFARLSAEAGFAYRLLLSVDLVDWVPADLWVRLILPSPLDDTRERLTYYVDKDLLPQGAWFFRLLKQFEAGYRVGASYLYQTGDLDAALLPLGNTGKMDLKGHAFSLGGGYARKYGENRPGKNIGVEMTVNFLYATRDFDEEINILGNLYQKRFDRDAWWFSWRNKLTHNFTEWLSVYGIFNLHQLLDETVDASTPLLVPSLPGRDETVGEVGGGITAVIGKGFAANAGIRTTVFNRSYDTLIVGGDISFKF